MAELVASRYSTALFEAGKELDKVDIFYKELKVLEEVLENEEEFFQVLGHPKISKREKKELTEEIFGDKISQELKNFLFILIDKNRQGNFLEIVKIYEELYLDYKGIVKVLATTAIPMEEDAKTRLSKVLGEKLNKKVEITNEIDELTIGGIKLEMEGKLIDGTIQGKLDSMARALKTTVN